MGLSQREFGNQYALENCTQACHGTFHHCLEDATAPPLLAGVKAAPSGLTVLPLSAKSLFVALSLSIGPEHEDTGNRRKTSAICRKVQLRYLARDLEF